MTKVPHVRLLTKYRYDYQIVVQQVFVLHEIDTTNVNINAMTGCISIDAKFNRCAEGSLYNKYDSYRYKKKQTEGGTFFFTNCATLNAFDFDMHRLFLIRTPGTFSSATRWMAQ